MVRHDNEGRRKNEKEAGPTCHVAASLCAVRAMSSEAVGQRGELVSTHLLAERARQPQLPHLMHLALGVDVDSLKLCACYLRQELRRLQVLDVPIGFGATAHKFRAKSKK